MLRNSYAKPTVAHASATSSKSKVELDSHANMCVVGDNYFVIHDHDRSVNVYSYNPKGGHRSAIKVSWSHDANCNLMGWAHTNPVLNAKMHYIELIEVMIAVNCHHHF